ncbi:hypothetical protein BJ508DRAFT_115586 [Ascobolus immersus RN42]|uniref:Uncharacterized protein n=1 Tax=Ascobolus immersus RN42 TaxID=1160509 RepID=A0A3N4I593_ASCIM|nr:hypothetical protein BJ508DRAFT_115586 [Ascobolus immersus RN42]
MHRQRLTKGKDIELYMLKQSKKREQNKRDKQASNLCPYLITVHIFGHEKDKEHVQEKNKKKKKSEKRVVKAVRIK